MRPDYTQVSDGELLTLTASHPEAFGVFYERFEAQVLGFFWRATRRADIAADLTAEVFAAALESSVAFRAESGSARGWLFGIARHELADTWERVRVEDRARRRMGVAPQTLTDDALERVEEIASRAQLDALQLLESLPVQQRLAVKGRVLQDLEYPELAASLSCSQSLVRQRVSRGLRALRTRLQETT
jgi:RNA polymerase sigma-70 factor (ECF subfamily)